MSAPALELENLCKSYGAIRAVDHLSLQITPGQMAGFLGPNGAGKSTTFYMVPGLVHPSAGQIRIFGRSVRNEYRQAIQQAGIMVESPAFYEYLSGYMNLELVGRLRGGIRRDEIEGLLRRVGLAERQHDKVRTYSQGMKQRLGIARALLGNPRLLLLDEPTNGMDPEGTRELLTFLREQVKSLGLTVFLSSHLLHEVEEYCDTVFVVNKGRLAASGDVKAILKPHENIIHVTFAEARPEVLSLTGQEKIAGVQSLGGSVYEFTLTTGDSLWLNQFLLGRGLPVKAIAPKQKNLKEFFLSITGPKREEQNVA